MQELVVPSRQQRIRKNMTEFCSIENKDPKLLIAILRNHHHISCHCNTCFKKIQNVAPIKIPKPESLSRPPDIMLYTTTSANFFINWYDWTGQNISPPGRDYSIYFLKDPTAIFLLICIIIVKQRLLLVIYLDANRIVFGCNTNIGAVDGSGSAMYCSILCYTIKSTKQENDEHFNKSCACMVCKVHAVAQTS
jgi:hypothetical protein